MHHAPQIMISWSHGRITEVSATGLSKGLTPISLLRSMSPVHGRGKRGNKDDPIPLRLLGDSLAWRSVPLTVYIIFFHVPLASNQQKCYDTWTTPINSLPARRRSFQYR